MGIDSSMKVSEVFVKYGNVEIDIEMILRSVTLCTPHLNNFSATISCCFRYLRMY